MTEDILIKLARELDKKDFHPAVLIITESTENLKMYDKLTKSIGHLPICGNVDNGRLVLESMKVDLILMEYSQKSLALLKWMDDQKIPTPIVLINAYRTASDCVQDIKENPATTLIMESAFEDTLSQVLSSSISCSV